MGLPLNSFKAQLDAGTRQIGFWLTLGNAYAAEIIAGAGFDWALIDMEHSPADLENVLGQLQAIAAYDTAAVVRVPQNDPVIIKRILDAGALTILVPYVESPKEAEAAVAAMRYPPHGIRGVAGTTRASRFGRIPNYGKLAESQLCLIVQVETMAALNHLDAIASVDGVDGVFFGPADLAASMGHVGEPGHPDVKSTILEAIRRTSAMDVASGLLTLDPDFADACFEAGARFVAVGVDANALARAADGLVARCRN